MGRNVIRLGVYVAGRGVASVVAAFHASTGEKIVKQLGTYHSRTSELAANNAASRRETANRIAEQKIEANKLSQEIRSVAYKAKQEVDTIQKFGDSVRKTVRTSEQQIRQTEGHRSLKEQKRIHVAGALDRKNLTKAHHEQLKIITTEKRIQHLDFKLDSLAVQEDLLGKKRELQGQVEDKSKVIYTEEDKLQKNDIDLEKSALNAVKKYRQQEASFQQQEQNISHEQAGIELDHAQHLLALDIIEHQLQMDIETAEHGATETRKSAKHGSKTQKNAVTDEQANVRKVQSAQRDQRKYLSTVSANLSVKELRQLREIIKEEMNAQKFERLQVARVDTGQNVLKAVDAGTQASKLANSMDVSLAGKFAEYTADVLQSRDRIEELMGKGTNMRELLSDLDQVIESRKNEISRDPSENFHELKLDAETPISVVREMYGNEIADAFQHAVNEYHEQDHSAVPHTISSDESAQHIIPMSKADQYAKGSAMAGKATLAQENKTPDAEMAVNPTLKSRNSG